MKELLVKDIVRVCNGTLICGDENERCENFSNDTRQIHQGDIYLGIKGTKINGSLLYEEAFKKGAKGCILQEVAIDASKIEQYKNKFIVIVPDVVKALQALASYKRSLYDIPVIAITGSVGKTSTKDMIASVLSTKYHVLKTEGNYNNEIGLPLTILKLKDHNAMVVEMGMCAFGEIRLLTNIAKPTTAVITTIGSSHIGNLGSRENILKAKLEILEGLDDTGVLIINHDNDLLNKWNKTNQEQHIHKTYGIENKSTYQATNVQVMENSSSFQIEINHQNYTVTIPTAGKHFVYNCLAAVAVGIEYHVDMENIIKGIAQFSLTKSRMEVMKNKQNVTIINDCYNASYESIKAALEYLHSLPSARKIAVLGDVLELGDYSKQMHEKIGKEVLNNDVDILITVGEEAKTVSDTVNKENPNMEVYSFSTNIQAIELLKKMLKENDCVLVKASNGMHFKEIVEAII